MQCLFHAESGAFAALLLGQKASYTLLHFVLVDVTAGKHKSGGESWIVTWKSQDPAALPETGMKRGTS